MGRWQISGRTPSSSRDLDQLYPDEVRLLLTGPLSMTPIVVSILIARKVPVKTFQDHFLEDLAWKHSSPLPPFIFRRIEPWKYLEIVPCVGPNHRRPTEVDDRASQVREIQEESQNSVRFRGVPS